MSSFKDKVLEKVKEIPRGKVITYKELAKAMGKPGAVRAVANALGNNSGLVEIPCHRVIRSDGRIGGYALGPEKKKEFLEIEGIIVDEKDKVDLDKFLYKY